MSSANEPTVQEKDNPEIDASKLGDEMGDKLNEITNAFRNICEAGGGTLSGDIYSKQGMNIQTEETFVSLIANLQCTKPAQDKGPPTR